MSVNRTSPPIQYLNRGRPYHLPLSLLSHRENSSRNVHFNNTSKLVLWTIVAYFSWNLAYTRNVTVSFYGISNQLLLHETTTVVLSATQSNLNYSERKKSVIDSPGIIKVRDYSVSATLLLNTSAKYKICRLFLLIIKCSNEHYDVSCTRKRVPTGSLKIRNSHTNHTTVLGM